MVWQDREWMVDNPEATYFASGYAVIQPVTGRVICVA